MTQRTYGAVRAAGVQVQEQETDKTIEGEIFGVTGYAGILERGPTDKLISTYSKSDFARKCGGRIAESTVPDCCQDFWDHSKGNGELHLARVDDGTGVQAERIIHLRRLTAGKLRIPLALIKAHNVGKWAGKRKVLGENATVVIGDYTATTLDTHTVMLVNEWKGGTLVLDSVPGKTYNIVGNDAAGVITVDSDQDLLADLGVPPPADLGWNLLMRNEGKAVGIEIGIDDQDPTNYFYLMIHVDGEPVKTYEHLSIDPASARYYKKVIDDTDDNWEIEITNYWTGGVAADVKPGYTGYVTSLGVGGKTLNIQPYFTEITSPGNADPTIAVGTPTSAMEWEDKITLTVLAGALTASVNSAKWGDLGTLTLGVLFTPNTPYLPTLTVTNGATVLAVGDVVEIEWVPLIPDALKNGTLIPKLSAPSYRYNIVGNTVNSVTVVQDMTASGVAPADQWMITAPFDLRGGYDGIWGLTDADYVAKFDTATSPFNSLRGKNKGLVKLAAPEKTATDVQHAGQAYAEFNAYEWREEIPSATTTEDGAITHVNDTIGRNDFTVVTFPSFAYVTDPDKPDLLKLIPQTGAIHGMEAAVAAEYRGYHRAAAGTVVGALPRVKKLTTTDELDDERLNPAGIAILKKWGATYYEWGDRTVSLDPAWLWKHQREQASHYINVLLENFPWAIFDINDVLSDMPVLTALTAYFKDEYDKRALNRDLKFKDACVIKMDGSVNTPITRSAGDKIATIALAYANVTERLILKLSKQGIYESIS